MTNRTDLLFSFVLQRDRRQVPDRRAFPRGGRRAVDLVAGTGSTPVSGTSILWTDSPDKAGPGAEKPVIH